MPVMQTLYWKQFSELETYGIKSVNAVVTDGNICSYFVRFIKYTVQYVQIYSTVA